MHHVIPLSLVPVLLVSALGCGLSPAPAPEPDAPTLTPVPEPSSQAVPAGDAPSEEVAAHDAGRGWLHEDVAVALETVYGGTRRVRCEAPAALGGEGLLEATWMGPGEEHLRGVTVVDNAFAAVVPVDAGEAVVRRAGRPVGKVVWPEAPKGVWSTCRIDPIEPFQILGLVEGADEVLLKGATVRGCLPGDAMVTGADGRFELSGFVGVDCPILAIVDDGAGLGRSDTIVLTSDGADVITELQIAEARLDADTQDVQAKRMHGVMERQVRNGIAQEVEALARVVAEAQLDAGAKAVAEGWVADLRARAARQQALVDVLAQGGKDGLVGFWMTDL